MSADNFCAKTLRSLPLISSLTLHKASKVGDLNLVKCVLLRGFTDINCLDALGRTPVVQAARKGRGEMFDFLVSQGCDLPVVDVFKDTVLHAACEGGNTDIVKKIIEKEYTDIDVKGWHRSTPVITAAGNGQRKVFDLLVNKGCDLTVVDTFQRNILHVACIEGQKDIVKYVLSQGISDIESRERRGKTPLLVAVMKGHKEVVELLSHKHCNLTAVDYYRNNALHLACKNGHLDIAKYIRALNVISIDSRGSIGRTLVMEAAEYWKTQVLDVLVNKGCNISISDEKNNTVLHIACIRGSVDMVENILSQNVLRIDSGGFKGRTPVMIAAENGNRPVFDLLMRKGCNLAVVDVEKNNILHRACYQGHVEIVKYLITLSVVDMTAKNKHRQTPKKVAELKGHRNVVDLLDTNT